MSGLSEDESADGMGQKNSARRGGQEDNQNNTIV